jgi:hypothetical protein
MSRHHSLTTAMAVLLLASPLAAQGVSQDTLAVSVTPTATPVVARSAPDSSALLLPMSAPAWTNVGAGVHVNASAVPVRQMLGPESSQSVAMMIVGGAGLLVGAVVGGKAGTTLMVGGGVLGLIGLWRYAR